jgi:hypothetical protein
MTFTVVAPSGKIYGEVISVVPIKYLTVGTGSPDAIASKETNALQEDAVDVLIYVVISDWHVVMVGAVHVGVTDT